MRIIDGWCASSEWNKSWHKLTIFLTLYLFFSMYSISLWLQISSNLCEGLSQKKMALVVLNITILLLAISLGLYYWYYCQYQGHTSLFIRKKSSFMHKSDKIYPFTPLALNRGSNFSHISSSYAQQSSKAGKNLVICNANIMSFI